MTENSVIRHETYTVRVMSYHRDGEWIPLALVSSPRQCEEDGHPICESSNS
jgi:hypothetical protein